MKIERDGLVSGAAMLTFSALLVKVLGVVYKIPLSYILGDEGMGYFNSAYSVYGFFYIIASTGIPKALTMLVTEARQESGDAQARRLYLKSLKIFAVFAVAITSCFLLLSKPMSELIGNSKSFATMLTIAPSILFITLSGISRGYLNGKEKLLPIAISQLIEAISKLVLGVLFAYLGMRLSLSLPMISAFTVLGITIGSFFSSAYLYIASFSDKTDEKTKQNVYINTKMFVKKVIKIALPITLSSSVVSVSNIIDLGITMRSLEFLGYTEAECSAQFGNYTTLAVPMLNMVVSILTPISVAILPRMLSAHLKRESGEFNRVLLLSISICASISAPAMIVFGLYSFEILDILFSSQASLFGAELLSILSPAVFIVPILTIINTALEAAGKIKLSVCSLLFGAFTKITFSMLLIRIPTIGILGAPIGTVASYTVSLVLSLLFLRVTKGKGINTFTVMRPILTSVVAYIGVYLVIFGLGALKSGSVATVSYIMLSTFLYACMEFSTIKRVVFRAKNSKIRQKT